MELRPATEHDRAIVVSLWQETGLTRPWNDPVADFDRAVAGPVSTVLVAVDEGRPVASAMVGFDGHRGWVYYVAVAPGRQGEGLGRAVMAAAETWLRDAGAPKVQLMVRRENAAAYGFYEALGYSDAETDVMGRWLA